MSTRFAVIIVAAGSGSRMNAETPKQFLPFLGERTILGQTVHVFDTHPHVDVISVVLPDHHDHNLPAHIVTCSGGASRKDSVLSGLKSLSEHNPEFVLIHDAARCGIDHDLITRVMDAVDRNHIVVPTLPIADTVRRKSSKGWEDVSRDGLDAMQTPQAVHYQTYKDILERDTTDTTDDASSMLNAGYQLKAVLGSRHNFKITYPEDLDMMRKLQDASFSVVGQGFDVHQLREGTGMMLGGVHIACELELVGHSDADVLLHAITDAVCGASGLGDIGQHFPPSDAQWKNKASDVFLRKVIELASQKLCSLVHIDATIIGEKPKISPMRDAIQKRVADICQLPISCVNIKATTTEKLGFTGREEGLAAMAVVTMRRM